MDRLKGTGSAAIDLAAEAEHSMLTSLPFFDSPRRDPMKPHELLGSTEELNQEKAYARNELIYLDEKRFINTLIMDCDGDRDWRNQSKDQNLVITHGFGAGIGFWFKNYSSLSRLSGWRVFSVDWLGMGRSSRTPLPNRLSNESEDIDQVEAYFVESLEEWRQKCKIEKMTLMGHSLGGYLSAVYALKYPQHVSKLILASPGNVLFTSFCIFTYVSF